MTSHTRRISGGLLLAAVLTVAGGLLPAAPALAAGPKSQPITVPYVQDDDGASESAIPTKPRRPGCRPPDCYYA